MLLHIIDSHDPERLDNIDQVHAVLKEIKADDIPTLQVYNKIDLLEGVEPKIQRNDEGVPVRVWCSAVTGEGAELLQQAIIELLSDDMLEGRLTPDSRSGAYQSSFI